MDNYYFYYELYWWLDGTSQFGRGITYGHSMSEAMARLASYYGEDDIEVITMLVCISEGGECMELSEMYYGIETYRNKVGRIDCKESCLES